LPLSPPGLYPTHHASQPAFEAIRSQIVFEGPIRHALHSLKYGRKATLGNALGPFLAAYTRKPGWQDLGVPEPLGSQRRKARGYNQVRLLAMSSAAMPGWAYLPKVLVRKRTTPSQVGLSPLERMEKRAAAFRPEPAPAAEKAILWLDDVVTSAASLAACSGARFAAGAQVVYALTLARALPHHRLQIV